MTRIARPVSVVFLFLFALADARADRVDDYVRTQMRRWQIPGTSVAVIRGGRIVLARGYGLANVEHSVPATKETVYELQSVTKQFTATAILMLEEAGKVSLSDRVARYVPDAPATWDEVTVQHLLTHTSGIPDYTDAPSFFEGIRLDRSPGDLLKPVMTQPLSFKPGTQWRYSNANYYLLGMIIEKVSGKSWAEFLQERIFQPLQMKATRVNSLMEIIPRRASGYHLGLPPWIQRERAEARQGTPRPASEEDKLLHNADYVSPMQKWAAGAVVSTVMDLAKWDAALDTEKLLKRPALRQMVTPARLSTGTEAPYGFGNELRMDHGHRAAGHQGGGLAYDATFLRYPEDRLTVIVLCNLTQAPSRTMARHIAALYLPDLSDERNRGIADTAPKTTAILKAVLLDAQQGKADPARFAPEAQAMLPFIQRAGPQFLGRLGPLNSFVLLERKEEGKKLSLRYRAVFGETSLLWNFDLAPDGKILSLEPTPE